MEQKWCECFRQNGLLCSSHSAVHIAAVMRRRLQQSSAGVSEEDGRGEDVEEEREGKERGRGKGAMPPNMLKVSFLCVFAYGVHCSLVDLNYHYHEH